LQIDCIFPGEGARPEQEREVMFNTHDLAVSSIVKMQLG